MSASWFPYVRLFVAMGLFSWFAYVIFRSRKAHRQEQEDDARRFRNRLRVVGERQAMEERCG